MDDISQGNLEPFRERRPSPDPTALTTAALEREVAAIRELFMALLSGMDSKITTRLEANDKAIALIQHAADRIPTEVQLAVMHLQSLHEERFRSIDIQLHDRDVRADENRRDSRIAVDTALAASKEAVGAALQAAKEAVGKTEMAFTKSIDQLGIQTQTETRALDSKMGEMKDRLEAAIIATGARAEAAVAALRAEIIPQITMERSRGDVGSGRQMGQGALVAIILGCISALGVVVGIIVMLVRLGN